MEDQDWTQVVIQGNSTPQKDADKTTTKIKYDPTFQKLDGDEPDAPKKPSNEIRIQISTARNRKGLTQKQLASSVKPPIKPDIINQIESGKIKPEHQLVQRIGKALGIIITTKSKK